MRNRANPPPPRWKLHKGPSRGSVLVGQSAPFGFVKARNERGCSSDVEEKTTNFYENKEVEEYWKKVRREAKRPTGDEDARDEDEEKCQRHRAI